MKCPKCGGPFEVCGGLHHGKITYEHHLVEIPGFGIRTRKCANCKYRTKTVEIDVYQHLADSELIVNLFDILETYGERRNKGSI